MDSQATVVVTSGTFPVVSSEVGFDVVVLVVAVVIDVVPFVGFGVVPAVVVVILDVVVFVGSNLK